MSGPKLCTRCVFNQFLLSYKVVWICSYQSSGSASFHICLFPPPGISSLFVFISTHPHPAPPYLPLQVLCCALSLYIICLKNKTRSCSVSKWSPYPPPKLLVLLRALLAVSLYSVTHCPSFFFFHLFISVPHTSEILHFRVIQRG